MSVLINASTSTGLVQSADTSGEIELQSNGTTALKVNTNEGIQILNCLGVGNATPSTSGAGITFPATQSASSDANTLDDYEEGTFTITPTTGTSGSVTTGNTTGAYTKVGRLVTVTGYVDFSSVSSPVGYLRFNLPFTSASGTQFESAVSFMFNNVVSANVADFIGTVNNNSVALDIYLGNGTTVSATSANQIQASTSMRFQATYMTA